MRKAMLLLLLLGLSASAQTAEEEADPKYAALMCRIVTSADLADSKAPSFSSFPAGRRAFPRKVKLDLGSNPTARKYRTVLRNEMHEGVSNFAGHYRVAVWGCGTACTMFAVVDLASGRVITAPHVDVVDGVEWAANDFLKDAVKDESFWAVRFENDSRLFVVVGRLDETRQGAFYFLLTGNRLKLIHTTPVHKNCAE